MISMTDPTPTRFDASDGSWVQRTGLPCDSGLDVARGMGWFSVGRGVAQLLAPGLVGALTGVRNNKLLRLYGLRELACGVGILNSERPAGWMWARVGGDVMDFATILEVIASGDEQRLDEAALALVAVASATMTDVMCANSLSSA